jgi:hypothetical protein
MMIKKPTRIANRTMTHRAAFHMLFSRDGKTEYNEHYKEDYVFNKRDLHTLAARADKASPGMLHRTVGIVLVGE